MRVFLDAPPRWSAGILTHLKGILTGGHIPQDIHVILHCTDSMISSIGEVDNNVEVVVDRELDSNPILMNYWRKRRLPKILKKYSTHVHFNVIGNYCKTGSKKIKSVVMSRNIQPHMKKERKRTPFYKYERIRLEILNRNYKASFKNADGVIFLSDYAREIVKKEGVLLRDSVVIPHGLPERFRKKPTGIALEEKPTILYVSAFRLYKCHWAVVRAVDIVRKQLGLDLRLNLIGGEKSEGWKLLQKEMNKLSDSKWINIVEKVDYSVIHKHYHEADLFVFASTVETISHILIEAMASGLPIAYCDMKPMTDILGDGGVKFEAENPMSIAKAIKKMILNHELRNSCAQSAFIKAKKYNWKNTSNMTFKFIRKIKNTEKLK